MMPRVVLPRLHPAQQQIVDHAARFKVIAAGRRFGKGVLGVGECLRVAAAGGHAWWVAPDYSSAGAQAAWRLTEAWQKFMPGTDISVVHKRVSFPNGGFFEFRSAENPVSLRGEGIDLVVIDEAAQIKNLRQIDEQCIHWTLLDRGGSEWYISTPKGFNYFEELWRRGRDGVPGWASFRFSSYDNPHISREEIEALKTNMPELVVRQEIHAEFVQLAGAMFRREHFRIIDRAPEPMTWVRAWDLAFTTKTSADYTVGAKMAMGSDGTVFIGDLVVARVEWPDAVRLIGNTARLDGPAVRQGIECVGAQVGVLQTLLRDPLLAGLVFEPVEVQTDKVTRALPLLARAEAGKVAFVTGPNVTLAIDQLCGFPEVEHDDIVDALSAGLAMLALRPDVGVFRIEQRRETVDERVREIIRRAEAAARQKNRGQDETA